MQVVRYMTGRSKVLREWKNLTKNYRTTTLPATSIIEKQNFLFTQEQKKQMEAVGRIDKIIVDVAGPPEDITLVMNCDVSTPFDCAKRDFISSADISLGLCNQAALALINDSVLWDMHRPLMGNCKLKFLTFKDKEPYNLNKTFWRTGSFILGAIVSRAFKDQIPVHLHSFPPPFLRSGSFVYDVFLGMENDWKPTIEELKVLSAEFLTFVQQNHKIERLRVKKSLAADIFDHNPFKHEQISSIAAKAEDHKVTLYRVGDHIDISSGPMVANTSFFGRCTVANVIPIGIPLKLHRFQAVALPKGIMLNQYAYSIVEERARKLNELDYPWTCEDEGKQPYGTDSHEKNSLTDVPKSIYHYEF